MKKQHFVILLILGLLLSFALAEEPVTYTSGDYVSADAKLAFMQGERIFARGTAFDAENALRYVLYDFRE